MPAVLAIFEMARVFEVNTREPAPKSVTSMVLWFANSDFL